MIGKIIVIFINKKIKSEDFVLEIKDDGSELLRVVSHLNWYKIYEIKYDEHSSHKEKYERLINEDFDVRNGHLIEVNLKCGQPNEILIFQRYDYMKGKVYLQNPGKDGVIRIHGSMSHTIKSIVFYLVK